MSVFKVMQGRFGVDGLEHKWSVFQAEDEIACWKHIFDTVMDAEGPMAKHIRADMLASWIEEHTDPNDDYSAIRTNDPYPGSIQVFTPPDYIRALMGRPGRDFEGTERLRQPELTGGAAFVKVISELPRSLINELLR